MEERFELVGHKGSPLMRTTVTFSIYEAKPGYEGRLARVARVVLDELGRILPDGIMHNPVGERRLECALPEGDARVMLLLQALEAAGYRPGRRGRANGSTEFSYEIHREYEDQDRESAEYLTANSAAPFAVYAYRSKDSGNLQLPPGRLPKGVELGQADVWLVTSDAARSKLEKEGLEHLVFRPVEQAVRVGGPNVIVNGYWEVTSDLVLPALSRTCVLMNNDGEVFSGDYRAGCFLIEDHYIPAEFHFNREAIRAVEPFDLALTREKFGNTPTLVDPTLVASHRFYEVCKKHGFKMRGIPVRIDEG
jgi:hypothetical protein